MKKTREFDNILDECLERMLTKGESIEQCLAGYPEYAAELEPLLRTALVSKQATSVKPLPEFRERASHQFQVALREMETKKQSRGFFSWQPRWATAVIVVIVLLLASSVTVAAAGNSLPDEPLYQVKLATEAVQLTLTPSALGKAELYVKLADKRVDEIIKMAEKGKVAQVERTTQRLNTQLLAMASLAGSGGEEISEGEAATLEAKQSMMAEAPQADLREIPQAQLRRGPPAQVEEAPTNAVLITPGPPEHAGPAGDSEQDDNGAKSDKQARLKGVLSRSAVENQDALQAVLEKVPESVKSALQQAIEIAGAGYEQALRSLD